MPTKNSETRSSQPRGGQEYLANLQDGAHLLSESHTFVQGIVAVILGAAWWFSGLIDVLSAPNGGGISLPLMLRLALPTLGIVLVWVYAFDWLQKMLYPQYLKRIRAVFQDTDLTVQLMGPELPENIAKVLSASGKPAILRTSEVGSNSFAQRFEQTRKRYPALAEALGQKPFPGYWGSLDTVLLPLLVVSGVLMLMLAHSLTMVLVFLATTMLLASLKYALFTARQCAIRVVLRESLSDGEYGGKPG